MKEQRFYVVLLSVLMLMAGISGCGKAGAEAGRKSELPRPVKAIALKQSPKESVLVFPGKAKAEKEVNLGFRVGGPLIELNVDDGMKVAKGDILARIDPRDFRVRVKTLEAQLAASRAHYEESALQFKRYKNLVKVNAASRSTYDQVKAGYEMAKARVDADGKNLEAARNGLKDTVLYAPFSGYVHKTLVENHETVKNGQPVIRLFDLSVIEVEIGIPESLLNRIDDFTDFSCSFDADPGILFHSRLKEVGKKPNHSNSTYPLTITLDGQSAGRIRPGMAADVTVTIKSQEADERFVVPASALVNKSKDKTYLWILDREKGRVEKRSVTPVQLTHGGVEVQGKVREGEWVVIAGAHHLTDGQRARLLKPASETNIGSVL